MSDTAETATPSTARVSRRFSKAGAAEDRLLLELGKKYRVLAHLGEGGTARVWLAMARGPSGFNKLVVLKTIRGELFHNPQVVEMFLEEARLAARLNHPNIVQTNEVFETAQHPVIVMEYLDGLPFSAILERQREGNALALAMLLRIISDALSGLHAAHELCDYDGTHLAVVHRDISPHNLFVTFAGQTKVLDFGIAQFNASEDGTDSGVLKGKLRYVAPEQIRGGAALDRRADIYSMGVVLWEVATAQRMWSKVPEPTILKRILTGELPRAREVEPSVDPELQAVIERALSLDREARYESALDFQSDLDQYLATLGGALRNRDIGRALGKMFDDVREERRRTIEQQLARSDTLHDIQLSSLPLPELTSFSNVPGRNPLATSRIRPGPKLLVALALLTMGLFATVLFWPQSPTTPKVAPPKAAKNDAPLPRASIRSTDIPDTIALRITAFPRRARLILDGEPLSTNPHVHRVLREANERHELVVEADGFVPEERVLTFSHDQEFVLTLHPVAPKPKTAPVVAPKPRIQPSPPPSPARVPRPDPEASPQSPCEKPFYYDHRGIKKYRPECL